ncbi:Zn-dependent exopeptidase [Sodiomyces alkalinus F11]|uniref:Peptide hydrolase n=1 Tax=Sodiomyces alkalinus (strain CBS 110278 / VKM F-3762 / F11) TaxID=1314773 RepID=A0A3N2PRM6_SODAK|nr:Zn-dependent exopeptidase [Sodiomyces alkalinus F11]ROT37084.1 Zn-dependent exopeptidase [Sodiomyces alkalinus F11]
MRNTGSLASLALVLPALVSASADCKPYVDYEKLEDLLTLDDLLSGAQKLQDFADAHHGNRVFGSGGHNATVDYLYDSLVATNYFDVVKQPFTEIFADGDATLTIDGETVAAGIMTYTPGGSATGPLVLVPGLGCTPDSFPAEVAGNVAMVSRGECTFAAKSVSAKAAGALGLIIFNNVAGTLSGTLGEAFGEYAPVVGISMEDGQAIIAKLEAGEVTVDLQIDAVVEERVNFNVIAETKGGDHDNVLVLGGHSDSVSAGPGINDDGSGIIGVLNVALALTHFRVKNAVRFAFWGAEEYGLLGSYYYMRQLNQSDVELSKIRAYLNFDMIASPNYIFGIYDGDGGAFNLTGPPGSDVLERDFEEFYDSVGLPHVPTEFSGRSDYAAFIENGIPSGGLFTGAEQPKTAEEAALFGGQAGVAYDPNYHLIGDDINNLDHDAFYVNTLSIANSVAKYAISFDSLEPVDLARRYAAAERARLFKRTGVSAHGHSHSHSGPCGGGAKK